MKTTIDLPDPLFRRAKATAAVNGISLKGFITRAVEQCLESTSPDWPRVLADLPKVPKASTKAVLESVAEADAQDLLSQKQSELPGT